jgi:hypothetical protein
MLILKNAPSGETSTNRNSILKSDKKSSVRVSLYLQKRKQKYPLSASIFALSFKVLLERIRKRYCHTSFCLPLREGDAFK